MILFFDTETTGKLVDFKYGPEAKQQPDLVQLAMMAMTEGGTVEAQLNCIIQPNGWTITKEVAAIHGIDTGRAERSGVPILSALSLFNQVCRNCSKLVAFNIAFDEIVMQTAFHRVGKPHRMGHMDKICAMKAATPICKLPKPSGWKTRPGDEYKWPTLMEAYSALLNGQTFDGAHNAMNDVVALAKVYWELRKLRAIA